METRTGSMLQAIREAQAAELRRDPTVFICGEDLRTDLWGTVTGFVAEFGENRVRDLPLSEAGAVGMAVGAAMAGLRPIVDLTLASFMYLAMDQFVNVAAKFRYMYGPQVKIPVVFRAALWYHGGTGAQHADRPHPMFMNVPGLKIVMPSTPYDMKGLLVSAIREDDPVICFEDGTLRGQRGRGQIPIDDNFAIPLGVGDVKREGTDVTVVALGAGVSLALVAAEELAARDISVEVVDPRTLVPMDWDIIRSSVRKTGRLVAVDPANRTCSAASEIAATIAELEFASLKGPIQRVTTADVHAPYNKKLEAQIYPTTEKIVQSITQIMED
jgi:pyruvate/2-oxoglutarate/acetoin dehydrogenase E1 component